MAAKFQVGERVKIKGIEWWEKEKKSCRSFIVESFNNSRIIFNETMLKFLGKEATITKVNDIGYYINIDGYGVSEYVWGEEILESIKNTESPKENNLNWEQVRIQASIAAMQGIMSNSNICADSKWVAEKSVQIADQLIEELKKKGE